MPGFYYKNGNETTQKSNTQSKSKKKKGFYYTSNKDTKNTLKYNGTTLGAVTNKGLKAIENDTLDSYVPETEEEKRTLELYKEQKARDRHYANKKLNNKTRMEKVADIGKPVTPVTMLELFSPPKPTTTIKTSFGDVKVDLAPKATKAQVESFMQKQSENDNIFERYGIDPNKFTLGDFREWANEHNFNITYSPSSMQMDYYPKRKGGFLGIGGKKLTTEQEEKDAKLLFELARANGSKAVKEKFKPVTDFVKQDILGYDENGYHPAFEMINRAFGIESYYAPKDETLEKTNEEILASMTLEELATKRDNAKSQKDRLRYVQLYNTKYHEKNLELLANTKMEGTNHSVFDELVAVSKMKKGEEKDKRKKTLLETMDRIGVGADNYAVYTDDENFSLSNLSNFLGNKAMQGVASFNESIASTADLLIGKPLKAIGWENNPISTFADYTNSVQSSYAYDAEQFKQKLGDNIAYDIAGEITAGTIAAVPQAILAFMTAGTSLAGTGATTSATLATQSAYATGNLLTKAGLTTQAMAKKPSFWLSFAQSYGNDYEQALEMGASEEIAVLGATVTSLINAGIEIGGGLETLPEKAKKGGSKALKWWLSTLSEGGEEVAQKFVSNSIANLLYDDKIDVWNVKEYATDFALGTTIGSILGGGQIGLQNIYENAQNKKLKKYNEKLLSAIYEKVKIERPDLLENEGVQSLEDFKKVINKTAEEATETKPTVSTPTVVNPSTLNQGKVNTSPVEIGDTFVVNNRTGSIIKVVGKDNKFTNVEVTYKNGNTETMKLTNEFADSMKTNPLYTQTSTTTTQETTASETAQSTPTTKGVTSAYTNDNQKIDLRYKVVSADDLIVSNNADGSVNPNYPQELQPRDRERGASILQVQNIANNVVPEKLGESTNVSDGAPIVDSNNIVESGNGRSMALSLMYNTNPEGAKKYVEFITANADKFGIDVNNLPKNPVLVRERLTDVGRTEFVKKANESNLSSMNATELAKSDSERLTSDVLNLLVPNDDGNINTIENEPFISRVISNVFSQNDLNSVVGANNKLSANGLERIRNALFYKAYGDEELASRLSESLDNDIKNITNVLVNIAPKVVAIKNGISNGDYYDNLDFSQDIVDGINFLQNAKKAGLSVENFSNQLTIGDNTSDVSKAIAYIFEQKNRGAKQATLFFNHLFDIIMEKDPNQISFLHETKAPTKEDVVSEAINKYNNDEQRTGETVSISERIIPQGREESARENDTGGIGDNLESSTDQRKDDSESNRVGEQQGYVKETSVVGGNESTSRPSDSGTADSRPENSRNETKVGAGELTETPIEIETKLFHDIIDEVASDSSTDGKKGKHYYVSKNTPEIIVKKADIKDLPMIISFETLYLAVRDNGELEGHYHHLGTENTKKLYQVLSNPKYILRNNTTGRINIVSDIAIGKNSNSFVSIELDVYKNVENNNTVKHRGNYNLVITLFSAKDNYANNLKKDENITVLYEKKEDTSGSDLTTENVSLGNTKEISSDNNIPQDTDIVNSSISNNAENDTPKLTDKCELIATKHTATGDDIWVIKVNERLSTDDFKNLRANVKTVGGYYSNFAKTPNGKAIPGFVFKSEPTANEFKVFNDFFGYAEETPTQNAQNAPKSSESNSDEQTPTETENAQIGQNSAIEKENTDNDSQRPRVLDGESGNDDGGLQSESRNADEEKGIERVSGDSGQTSGEVLPSDAVNGGRNKSDVRNDSEGTRRADDNGDVGQERGRVDADGRGSGRTRQGEVGGRTSSRDRVVEVNDGLNTETEAPEVIETVDKAVEKKRPSNKENFVITNDVAEALDNNLPSAQDNIEAIELLLKIESEGRPATADEKKILAKYKGWGGIDIRRIDWGLQRRLNELYDYDQRRSMQDSGTNAFFTPTKVIDAMYNGLRQMGFKGGNVLETSMGIGNFFGRMPVAMTAKSALTGIELEAYTARIAQLLYPGATVINKPFQDVVIKNGSYDLVIGNVPFGNEKLSYNGKKYSLHNYFIISSLDKVKDGGVVAVITSAGTLDNYDISARSAIMDRADVVACYKLPAGVFSRNAKTDVQSDLLILRKRPSGQKPVGDSILNVTEKDGLRLNEYFVKHPENILGTLSKGTNAWGEITTVLNNGKFDELLNDAMKKLPKNLMNGEVDLKPVDTIVTTESKPRFFEKDGKVYADNGAGEAVAVTKNVDTVRDYIAVRDAYKAMLDAYGQEDMSEADIKPLREALNKAYDNFFAKHTAISGDGKKKIGKNKCKNNLFLEADSDYYLLCGLERYNNKENKYEKSALFDKDTLRKKKVTSVDTSSEALAISLNETGGIDFKVMSELTGKTEKELAEELKGEIVYTPQGKYELLDIYLSGDIYAKLEEVKGKPEFREQEEMLKKVLPTPKDASQITVKLGANYIDARYIEDFASEVFRERITVKKNSAGNWVIDGADRGRYSELVNSKYGCKSLNAVQLLQRILNDADIVCNKSVQQGDKKVSVFDKEMTDIALGKAQDIRDAFEQWIFKDTNRRKDIVDKYNRMYNAVKPLDYEHIASKLTFNSMSPTLRGRLYPHQRKGIARFLFGGNTLFAHGVGTGKTFEMIASVMEAKQMGIVNKTAMVVPNNKVVDFKRDILEAYPNAKVLVIDTANKKRQTMLGLVNSNDWDIILIARTTFTKIPVSAEMQKNFYNEQLEALNKEIYEAENDRNISKRQINSLITQRKNLEEKLKNLDEATNRDEGVDFDKLGIDCICVDEAHNYKSVTTPSKLQIKGLVNKNDAQQANDMLMKLDYLRSIDGKIIFGTGTPITNTVSEIYNMTRMVRPDILESAGIHSLDEWVNTFAKVESNFEIDIDGTIKSKPTKSIRSFVNGTELVAMFRQFADIVFTEDVVKNLPKATHHNIELKGTKEHKLINKMVNAVLSSATGTEKLGAYGSMSGMLTASAIDLRMLSGVEKDGNPLKDYSLEELDYENSKVNTMCGNILKHYNESQGIKGTQIVFCDGGAGSGETYTFNVHKDVKEKLIKLGIPENEIVIVKNQSDSKLEELYAQVNSGEVRVLIGTSAKMAEGLNVQERVVAIHHPTVSYKPSDLEQGDARGVRSGNINSEVHIYRYLQGDTFDSHKWQAIDRKAEMIRNALKGEDVGELEDIGADEDGGADIDPATAMAITSGNPLIKAKIDIDKKVNTLLTIKKNYQSEIYKYQDIVAKYPKGIEQTKALISKTESDIALRDKHGENTKIIIKGKSYEKPGEANKALVEAVKTTAKNGTYIKIGEYNGFDILFKGETGGLGYGLLLRGSRDYTVDYNAQGNTMARFAGVLNRLEKDVENFKASIDRMTKDLETARQEVNKPFEREAELQEALAEQKKITYDYEHYNEVKDKYEQTETTSDVDSDNDASYDKASVDDRWKTDNVEDDGKNKKDVALAKIVKKIHDRFGVTIATGKVQNKDARGVYKTKSEVIRSRETNNVPTIHHELGHHLDKIYSFSKTKKSTLKLAKALPQEFLNQYPANERGREAVAEFVRTYLKSKLEAHDLCPEFFNDFVTTLSEKDLKALDEIGRDFNHYLSMETHEKYKSAIVNSKRSLKEKAEDIREGGVEGVKDTVADKANDTYTKWIDSFNPIKQAVDFVEKSAGTSIDGTNNAYTLATNSLNATTIASYLVNDGFRDLNGNIVADEMSFKECIKGVNAKDLDTLSEYLVLKHALEVIKLDMRVFADDTLQDVDTINQDIADIERNHPEMIEASENLYKYQRNMLRYYLVESGLLTEEGFNAMVEKYPCYVPFYRDVSKNGQGRAKGTFANQKTPIGRIKGSGASILNPLESIVKNTEKFVKSATRNQVMQVLVKYANEADGFGQFLEKVPPDMIPHVIDITRYKEKFTENLQNTVGLGDYFNVTNLLDEVLNDTVMDFTPKANAGKRIVTVMENGHASYYQVHDEALYKAIAEMTVPQLEGELKTISDIMLPMKMLMTQVNPLFATSNFFRDFGTAYKHSQITSLAEFTKRYVGAFKAIVTNSETYQQYKAMGGGHSSKLATDIDQIKRVLHDIEAKDKGIARRVAYALFRHPLETITSINDVIESIPRVLEFTKTLESTGDLQQAIFNADDITTNFKRHGSGATAKAVNRFVFFNNASLQGLDKTRRSLTGKDAVSKWTKWALFALLSSALQYFWNRYNDEEGYEQLSSYTKNNFYNFSSGDGTFISIPKPRETAILDSFTERTIEYVFGNKDAFYDFGGYLAQNLLPPMLPEPTLDIVKAGHDVLGNTVLGGIVDIGYNEDFMGRPIESKYERNYLESWQRWDEGTSKLAYSLGQTDWARSNDMSPQKIDHLLSSYLGIIGSAIQAVFPMDETRKDVTLGLRNRFIKDSVYSNDVINILWKNTDKAEAQYKFNSTIDNAIEYEQNAIITNYVSAMYDSIYSLPVEEQREAKKYLLKELNSWDYDLTTSQQQMKTSLVDRGIESKVIIDLPSSTYEWTENKQKYSYQMTPEEYTKFVKNYLKEVEKYRVWCKKIYTNQDDYLDNLSKYNGAIMKYMRPYYNKQFKDKATKK